MSSLGGIPIGGGIGGAGTASPSATKVHTLFYMAMRLAGVTKWQGFDPSPDQLNDCLLQAQLMLGNANTDPLKIYSQQIQTWPLVGGQKTYQIGPGAKDWNTGTAPRPQSIEAANLVYTANASSVLRLPMQVLNFQQWGRIRLQDIPGGLPRRMYMDFGWPIANIEIWTQDEGGDELEIYTWNLLPKLATVNDVIDLPPGYYDWFVNNLAVRMASVFHAQGATVTDDTRAEALRSAAAIESMNAPTPQMDVNPAVFPRGSTRGTWNRFTGDDE